MDENDAIKKSTEGVETDKEDISVEGEGKADINPLEIPMVVKIVCGYISKAKHLKSLQTLGVSWRQETFKKWRNSAIFLINNETLPLLLRVFSEPNWDNLSEEEKANIDPFQLRQVPFKKYRFSSDQFWTYPLGENELDKKLIWEKVISANATYLDVGDCALKWTRPRNPGLEYSPGLEWILAKCKVTELAMAPIKSREQAVGFTPIPEKFKASNLNTMAIYSPRQSPETESVDKIKMINSFLEIRTCDLANMFQMTPNLQNLTLKLENDRQGATVMQAVNTQLGMPTIFLKSFNAVDNSKDWVPMQLLSLYQKSFKYCPTQASLQELRMTFPFSNCINSSRLSLRFMSVLSKLKENLTRLELEINCEMEGVAKLPNKTNLRIHWYYFPNLTHFKINLDYVTFPGRLFAFDLNNLKGMPSLQKFYFGTKRNHLDKSWITRKLDFVEDPSGNKKFKDVQALSQLQSFHFHGNFTKEALQWLGRMAANLKTLEVVLDEKNFSAVKEIWPGLRNLKLLPCSKVPEVDLTALENSNPSWNVLNESEMYSQCASIAIPDGNAK